MPKKSRKKPKANHNPSIEKKVKIDPTLISNPNNMNPSWRFQKIDFDGDWSWTKVDKNLLANEIIPKLRNFETMKWSGILGSNNHAVKVDKFSKAAQKRLAKLGLDDTEEFISLRLTGEKRIWGFRISGVLNLLWWDPKHEVCPSIKKHT